METVDKGKKEVKEVKEEKEEKHDNLFAFNRIALKAKYSFYSALVFFLFSNPETYLILQRILGSAVVTPHGAPTISGIFITTGLFFFTMLGLMLLPSE